MKRRLISIKIYFDRARMYLGYINFFMLNLVLINSWDNPEVKSMIDQYKWVAIPVLFLAYSLALIFIGYLDTRLGFREEEMRNNAKMNPIMRELLETVHNINNKVETIERNQKT